MEEQSLRFHMYCTVHTTYYDRLPPALQSAQILTLTKKNAGAVPLTHMERLERPSSRPHSDTLASPLPVRTSNSRTETRRKLEFSGNVGVICVL